MRRPRNIYQVVYADPPWPYRVWRGKESRTADAHYNTMTLNQIAALPVKDIVADDAALFLWVPPPLLEEVMLQTVIHRWGFVYKTFAFVWVKTTLDGTRPATGMGHYTRANAEPCLLGIRGSMPVENKGVNQIVMRPRARHSAKPIEVGEKIELLYPKAKKIELFARGTVREGWDAWGDEAENSIEW